MAAVKPIVLSGGQFRQINIGTDTIDPAAIGSLPFGVSWGGAAAVSAAGTTQGTATALTQNINQVTTVGAGQGVILPASVAGKLIIVHNKGANALLVYPPTSSAIDALGVNAGFSLAAGATQIFDCVTATLWYSLLTAGGGTTTNALTINNSGSGAASGSTFNGSAAITISYNSIGAAPLASPAFTGTPVLTDTTTVGSSGPVVGYRDIPTSISNAAKTFALSDAGRGFGKDNTTAYTYTVPANSSVAFPVGTVITVFNNGSSANITIAITTDTMYLAGTTTTGSRTLGPRGVATLYKVASTVWLISGAGLT